MTAGPETSREATRPIVVFAIDEGYAMPLAVTLRSILEASANADFDFRVLHTGISPATRARVQASLPRGGATLTWQEADLGAFSGCGTLPHITGVTYARLLLDRLLPDAKRAIYLDADTLVLTDLRRLWSTPLRGAPVGAVVDGVSPALRANEGALPGRPEVPRYFNAGVLLIDLERWRAAGVSAAATDYILRHPNSPYSDQDALNIALDGAWAELDCRWNCQAHLHFHDLKSYPETERPFIPHAARPLPGRVPAGRRPCQDRLPGQSRRSDPLWPAEEDPAPPSSRLNRRLPPGARVPHTIGYERWPRSTSLFPATAMAAISKTASTACLPRTDPTSGC